MQRYLQKDDQILKLVKMRMNKNNDIMSYKYSLSSSLSSGMKEKDAEKIDMAIMAMKGSEKFSMVKATRHDEHCFFEFEIEF